jgi:hypothetical protein
MTAAEPISVGTWAAQPDIAMPGTDAEDYVGRHRRPGLAYRRAPFTLRRLFYLARHRRR